MQKYYIYSIYYNKFIEIEWFLEFKKIEKMEMLQNVDFERVMRRLILNLYYKYAYHLTAMAYSY